MFGALITLLFAAGVAGLARFLLAKFLEPLDVAAKWGVSGLIGLGAIGTFTFVLGVIPGILNLVVVLLSVVGFAGLALLWKHRIELPARIENGLEWLFIVPVALVVLFALVGALAPSTMNDWDTLAYHLAVPKLWLQANRIYSVPFIHHSNFPAAIDNLFLYGLLWGGQAAAKTFSVSVLLFGLLAVFGLARAKYGRWAAWWAALAFAAIPLVVWESGTAYIDVAHGLYAGLGILFASQLLQDRRSEFLWLGAICLSLAAGTKYTGLQTIGVVGFVLLAYGAARDRPLVKSSFVLGFLALALASPWYLRNELVKGNPVFPFFYSRLGGEGWSPRHAEIYTHEQNTFGAGREMASASQPDYARNPLEVQRIGHAVLGLAYQPGRYVNPGQTAGLGSPLGAFGAALVATMLVWLFSGRAGRFEGFCLSATVVSLVIWFFLSQQSRYALALAPPLAVLLGGAVVTLPVGRILAVLTGAQAVYVLYLANTLLITEQLKVVLGRESAAEYQAARIPFYEPAEYMNTIGAPIEKVALYDEVFGFLLDRPYVWANPGHGTLIPYDEIKTGSDFASKMADLGFTHIYVNTRPVGQPREVTERWLSAAGLLQPSQPFEGEERTSLMDSFEQRWKVLVAEAAAAGELEVVEAAQNGRWVLFHIRR